LKLLDKVLEKAASHKIYAILDYHSIGFPPDGTYNPSPIDNTIPWRGTSIYAYTDQEIKDTLRAFASHYKNDDRVVFYEIFNEPIGGNNLESWNEWKAKAEELIDIIRTDDVDAKIIVNGLNYASNISFAQTTPINRPNIVYGIHPYPNNGIADFSGFGNVKSTYPVFATEFGFDPNAADGIHYKADIQYGTNMVNYLESNKISWTAWIFSSDWTPALLSDSNYNATASGALFKSYLQSH